jgi:hypothetical protein
MRVPASPITVMGNSISGRGDIPADEENTGFISRALILGKITDPNLPALSGRARPNRQSGPAPMAAISLRLTFRAFRPRSRADGKT